MAPYRCRIRDGCKDLVQVYMLSIHSGVNSTSATSLLHLREWTDLLEIWRGGRLVAMAKFVSYAYFRETGVGQEVH